MPIEPQTTDYALRKSEYEPYILSKNLWNIYDPTYPVSGRGAQGQRDPNFLTNARKILNDATKTAEEKIQAVSQLGIKLDLHGLDFFRMPGNTVGELEDVNGKLIADIINRKLGNKAVIKRVIEPLSRSATYSNWIRALGFQGEMIVNDINPLIPLTQREIVNNPDKVLEAIQKIKSDIAAIGRQNGFAFDERLENKFDAIFPNDKTLPNNEKAEKLKQWVRTEKASKFRQQVLDYFEDSLGTLTSITNGQLVVDDPYSELHHENIADEIQKKLNVRVAALFYVMQNAANNSDCVSIKLGTSGGKRIHLPISLLSSDRHYGIKVFPLRVNDKKIQFISHLHKNKSTEFVEGDGWELFKRADIGSGDLIILSGHFNHDALDMDQFRQRIDQDDGEKRSSMVTDEKITWRKISDSLWGTEIKPGKLNAYDSSPADMLGETLVQLHDKNQLLTAINQAQDFQLAMTELYSSNHLQAEKWLPIFSDLTENTPLSHGDSYSIPVIDKADPEHAPRILTTADRRIIDFMQNYNKQLEHISNTYDYADGQLTKRPDLSSTDFTDIESVDGLNAAITVKTLIQWFANKSRTAVAGNDLPKTLTIALQVHTYVGMAQMAHGTLEDIAKITKLYRAVASESQALSRVVSPLSHLSTAAGILLNTGSVVLDGIELAHAQNEVQRAVFGTQLAFDSAGLTASAIAISAGIASKFGVAGTATLGGVAGALTVPLAGLGIGFTALAEAFGEVAMKAQAVGNYFADLDAAYQQGGYRQVKRNTTDGSTCSVMEPIPGVVINKLDLKNKQLTFGSQFIYRTHHGSTGSGAINYFFWIGDKPEVVYDKRQAINIREGIGYQNAQVAFKQAENSQLILPATPSSYISYEYMILPFATGRHDRGFDVIRRLEVDRRFDYDFYVFPSEYIINKMYSEFVATAVTVILDEQDRDIVVPQLPDVIKGKLSYQLCGNGGEYRISLQDGVSLSLQADNLATRWLLDGSQLASAEISISGDQLQIGGIAITLSTVSCGAISLIYNKLSKNKINHLKQVDILF